MLSGSDTVYVLRYFDVIGRAEGCRLLLTAANASWTEEHPEWPAEKANQPFERLPVLVERSNGNEWILCESLTIERYLARVFGFMPTDLKQAALQEQMADQQADLLSAFFGQLTATGDMKSKQIDEFNTLFDRMVKEHGRILSRSSSKQHLFGDQLSYADISLYAFYKLFIVYLKCYQSDIAEIVKSKLTPEIINLILSIEKEPQLAPHFSKCDTMAAIFTAKDF
ncbi:hypothetical protein IW148_002253 [Coemansia sp. RSA 1199]|nr:hypothetical protein IW148_002253 [Coemansia sp. RSA 1199]